MKITWESSSPPLTTRAALSSSRDVKDLAQPVLFKILQPFIVEMDDILKLPSNEVTVLLEAIMMQSEQAKGFIISGFPRDTNDIQNYLERIGRMDGTILLNWHESAIVCQIDYGAKQGHVVKSEAQAELQHFKKEGIPVAEYFDFKQLLYVVSGQSYLITFTIILDRGFSWRI